MELILIHYSEIGLKTGNRAFFENKLIENIKKKIKTSVSVQKRYGKILIEFKEKPKVEKIINDLKFLPGVSNFSIALKAKLDLESIKEKIIVLLKDKKFESFKVISKRSNKAFELNSMELNKKIGAFVVEKYSKKVDLHSPELKIFIEVTEKETLVYCEKINGLNGLPTGSSGKVIASLSGGIDSPVASFLMMKRGCKIIFVHILNKTINTNSVESKIDSLVKELTKIQLDSKLYLIPFEEIQKELIKFIPSKYRMIIYRRFMMKLINKIALKEKAKAIVTGDSLGQVASQTIENIQCIYNATNYPIFNPLIGLNKEEIIKISKKIKTYDYSIMPYGDCCSFMIAKHPETKANLEKIIELEKQIPNQKKLIKNAIQETEKKTFKF